MSFADFLDNKPKQVRPQRRITQNQESGPRIERASDRANPDEVSRLVEMFAGVQSKAERLQGAIEAKLQDLVLIVDNPTIVDRLNQIYPDREDIQKGTVLPFHVYVDLMREISSTFDPANTELVLAMTRDPNNKTKIDGLILKYKGLSEDFAALINNSFFAVHLASWGLSFFTDPVTLAAIEAGAPNNPTGPAGSLLSHMLQAAQLLAVLGANVAYIEQFLQPILQILGVNNTDEILNVKTNPSAEWTVLRNQVEAYRETNKRTWANDVLEWANEKVASKIGTDPKYEAWVAHVNLENLRLQAKDSEQIVRPRTRTHDTQGSFSDTLDKFSHDLGIKSGPTNLEAKSSVDVRQDSVWNELEEFEDNLEDLAAQTFNKSSEIVADTADSLEAGYDMTRDMFNFFFDEAQDLNVVIDSISAFLGTAYGPDLVCCMARIAGATLDGLSLSLIGKFLQVLNVTGRYDLSSLLNKQIQDMNSRIQGYVQKKIISVIDVLFDNIIKDINQFIDQLSQDGTVEAILECGPIADLILLLKQAIMGLERLLIDTIQDWIEKFLLRRINIKASAEMSFEISLAGKIGDLLAKIAQILDNCNVLDDSSAETFLNELTGKATQPVIAIPERLTDDNFRDFIDLKPFTTPAGLSFVPGVQKTTDVADPKTINQCLGKSGKEDLIKLSQQTEYIRRRLRDTNGA